MNRVVKNKEFFKENIDKLHSEPLHDDLLYHFHVQLIDYEFHYELESFRDSLKACVRQRLSGSKRMDSIQKILQSKPFLERITVSDIRNAVVFWIWKNERIMIDTYFCRKALGTPEENQAYNCIAHKHHSDADTQEELLHFLCHLYVLDRMERIKDAKECMSFSCYLYYRVYHVGLESTIWGLFKNVYDYDMCL